VRIVQKSDESIVIEFSLSEVALVSNSLNEVCNGPHAVEEWEFGSRLAASRVHAQALLEALSIVFGDEPQFSRGGVTDLGTEAVTSRADFVQFVRALSEADESGWENPRTAQYLECLAAWVEDWPEELHQSWSDFAKIIIAATTYE
jgi:hypothetical protein